MEDINACKEGKGNECIGMVKWVGLYMDGKLKIGDNWWREVINKVQFGIFLLTRHICNKP